MLGVYHKRLLPNYAVFDEQRYFTAGQEPLKLFVVGGVRVGVSDLRGRVEPQTAPSRRGRPAGLSWW